MTGTMKAEKATRKIFKKPPKNKTRSCYGGMTKEEKARVKAEKEAAKMEKRIAKEAAKEAAEQAKEAAKAAAKQAKEAAKEAAKQAKEAEKQAKKAEKEQIKAVKKMMADAKKENDRIAKLAMKLNTSANNVIAAEKKLEQKIAENIKNDESIDEEEYHIELDKSQKKLFNEVHKMITKIAKEPNQADDAVYAKILNNLKTIIRSDTRDEDEIDELKDDITASLNDKIKKDVKNTSDKNKLENILNEFWESS